MRLPQFLQQHRLMGGAIVLAVTQFGASLAGLVRDNLLNRTFPPDLGIVDTYFAAFRPSDLLFQVCIMSALGTVFVPILAGHKAHGRREEMHRALSGAVAMGGLLFGLLGLVVAALLPWLAQFLVQFSGEQLELYIRLAQIALVTNFLFVFGNAFGQFLITEQKYWVYGLTPILYTLGTIAGTVWLTPRLGVYGPMTGTLLGAIVYTLIRIGAVFTFGFRWRRTFWHPDVREMSILMLPRMFALGALQIQLLLFDTIGSGLDRGSITINANTRNFQSVLVGVVGIALAQSAYSLISQVAAKKDFHRFRIYVDKGLGMMLLLTIPASVILVLAAPIAAWLVGLRGTAWYPGFQMALILYALSAPFESASHLLLRAFYALKDTLTPAILVVSSAILSVIIAAVLSRELGVFALPLGYSIGQVFLAMILALLLRRSISGSRSASDVHSPQL